ncbi:nucleotide-binding domain containing protein [Candidatus Entotheonella palauensis]|uniref:nucleotide-binding domain containing protein n=1 Tax=Candidatus Entotheonella palauensis TaxID=93172 RepID=UPI0015C42506|nr:nucleotide-binding domain containing protein [Candidatus Entotheonella palauensis]
MPGGRYTIDNVHYVQQGEDLVPAAQTEFAQDPVFPFSHSLMPAYIEEKTSGNIAADQVVCIGLEVLRTQGPQAVTEILMGAPKGTAIVVNGADARDIEVFVMGLLEAENRGRHYIYRTAADFVRVRAGITTKPLLAPEELAVDTHQGGLMIVGSHVAKSTEQLSYVLELTGVERVEIPVAELLDNTAQAGVLATIGAEIAEKLDAGKTVVAYTSRTLQAGATPEETLLIGKTVSDSICEMVRQLPAQPRFLIAKGGITSNDVATKGLGVKRAFVLGQLQPGVPVWETGPESKFPGMRYVIYPGNVGSPQGLADAIKSFGG